MNTSFVLAEFDIYCKWQHTPPTYRLYVNDELFAERDWVWPENYNLTQMLPILAGPGNYTVRLETMGESAAAFSTTNHVVVTGPAVWIDNNTLRIHHETV